MVLQMVALAGATVLVAVVAVVAARVILARNDLGTPTERATFTALHTASQAALPLREGLTPTGAARSVGPLRTLLGCAGVGLADASGLLAWAGTGRAHAHEVLSHADEVLHDGRTLVVPVGTVRCADDQCPVRAAVVAPVVADERVVGVLVAAAAQAPAGLVRAAEEVAHWVSTQVELAELDRSRTRAMEAELRALRAQISPHFVYNCLSAVAASVRTDPERARELLLEFADFTRYAFRRGGEFTTLADELRNVERYLTLEQARFGDRLQVELRIVPDVLTVAVPYLSLQPLVENAVRHGLEESPHDGRIVVAAEDRGPQVLIWVEDDGAGSDPDVVRAVLAGEQASDSVGLGNVDARLRQVFGDEHGLVVETAPGAGTKVSFTVPKFAPQARPGPA